MIEKVVMPKLGATMEQGTIDSWLVEVGDKVEEGDPIAEIQTDKITMEIESESTGVLLKVLYEQGDVVPVQQVIAYIGEAGEEIRTEIDSESITQQANLKEEASERNENNRTSISSKSFEKIRRTPIARRIAAENDVALEDIIGTGPLRRIQKVDVEKFVAQHRQFITPLAQKMATDKQVNLSDVSGSGIHGKIIKDDILAASEPRMVSDQTEDTRTVFKGMRKVIADNITYSFFTAPHVTLHSEVDMTEIVKLRTSLLPIIEEVERVRVSYNEIILKATAVSLKKNPNINISMENEKEIVHHNRIDIGMAVSVSDGLVVPVLRNVDKKGLAILTKEAKTIAKRARDGKLAPEEMQGSTFTISNLGMYAVDEFTPIINQPNAAILGIGQMKKKPVVIEDNVVVRSIMTLSLSFDHRIIDGAPAAKFLTDIKDVLEQPYKLMI